MGLFQWLFGGKEQTHTPQRRHHQPSVVQQETSGCCSGSDHACNCAENSAEKSPRLDTCCGDCPCLTGKEHGQQCCFSCCCNQLDNIRSYPALEKHSKV